MICTVDLTANPGKMMSIQMTPSNRVHVVHLLITKLIQICEASAVIFAHR